MKKGKFIVFEGLDASGKSTIAKNFAEQHNFQLLGAIPKVIKPWLSKIGDTQLPEATFAYFTLCNILRGQDVTHLIDKGINVALDRYVYTTYIYHQELLQDRFPSEIKALYQFQEMPKPDLILFLDVPFEIRSARIKERNEELQWYGDKVSKEKDLTDAYFNLFGELKLNVKRIDNHTNSIEESLAIVSQALAELPPALDEELRYSNSFSHGSYSA